ncbi:MAG: 50S ribosomal protein L35 [Candidatus Komeilibacteria bacterium RIFCSPLOWO2_01_FULL_45_10]|uniref:Large ribosomal subunit protein bL35 n=1 Tax=Candidatus Komeilibacteria bacterium RIFCSPLOWO2_01_FULL_45_10 TaxID=1798550 RepID=A0A1G2BJ14_9BACT|nr:MAG: 50S ribosomal protein L35 [Candidatus Komeilibacteria bacterium RIFCSPLOWO2_01_FULL_45_10]
MKLKTHQSIAKRIKITKNGKLKIRTGGQDHFNARESGKTKRNKRRDGNLSKSNVSNIKKLLPYS